MLEFLQNNANVYCKHNTDLLIPIFPKGIIFFDVETTGLSPLTDRVIEFSALRINIDGSFDIFDELINPEIDIPNATTLIHGIKNNDVLDKSNFKTIYPKLEKFIGETPLFAHNAAFDAGFLLQSFILYSMKNPLKNKIYCSLKWSRKLSKHKSSHKLLNLTNDLNIKFKNHHRALSDSIACYLVVLETMHTKRSIKTLEKVKSESYLFKLSDFDLNKINLMPEHLTILNSKIRSKTVLDIVYSGGSYKNKRRPIKPIAIIPAPHGNILYGLCLLTNIYKTFAVKKISKAINLTADQLKKRIEEWTRLVNEDKSKNE